MKSLRFLLLFTAALLLAGAAIAQPPPAPTTNVSNATLDEESETAQFDCSWDLQGGGTGILTFYLYRGEDLIGTSQGYQYTSNGSDTFTSGFGGAEPQVGDKIVATIVVGSQAGSSSTII